MFETFCLSAVSVVISTWLLWIYRVIWRVMSRARYRVTDGFISHNPVFSDTYVVSPEPLE